MLRFWRVVVEYGVTTHRTTVVARSHDEAYREAIRTLNLKYELVGNAVVLPTLRRSSEPARA
jgi:hypothetical protein